MMTGSHTSSQLTRRTLSGHRLTPRKIRLSFGGSVRALLDFDPWRIMFHLDGINISETGILTVLKNETSAGGKQPPQIEAATGLFTTGDPFTLQIEHDCPALAAPVVSARLRWRRNTAMGIELAFAFDRADADLALLIDELAQRFHG